MNTMPAIASFIVLAVLSGCSTAGEVRSTGDRPAATTAPSESGSSELSSVQLEAVRNSGQTMLSPKWVSITPLSQLASNRSNKPDGTYSSAYTRLVITSKNCSDGKIHKECNEGSLSPHGQAPENPVYAYKKRYWLSRLLWGTRNTITLTSKITAGSFEATVPLVTFDHISNTTDGEASIRTVYHSAQQFPLFLVKKDGSNAIVSMKFSVKASSENKSNIAAAVIQTAQSVAKIASPQSAVLTTLSEQSTKDLAKAIDTTVSKILATTVDEEQWMDNDIRYWDKKRGVAVTFMIPREGTISWDIDDDTFQTVGQWAVNFEHPRPSIFSDVQICDQFGCETGFAKPMKAAQDDTDKRPDEVLAFKLVNGAQDIGTVSSYLKQQEWWSRHQLEFAKAATPAPPILTASAESSKVSAAAPDPMDEEVRSFCHAIKSTIVGLNLNSVDAGIVATAVRNSGLVSQAVAKRMANLSDDCGHAKID